MDINEQAKAILAYGEICDHCLGRFFGKRSHGLSNDERGRGIRIASALAENRPYKPAGGSCWVCANFFDSIPLWADRVADAVKGIEFSTFLVGCRVPPLIAENEEMVWSDLSLTDPEPFKSEVNREVGKAVSARIGRIADIKKPEVVVILDPASGNVEVQINSVFFYGRYQKFERGIPQTHWDCRVCRGKGCEKCNFTGAQYLDSVEELIGRPVIELFNAENAVLHGAGREDIDARMVGTGRPFILEVVAPKKRSVDLAELEAEINRTADGRVSVALKRWADRSEVETLKSNKAHKKYRILVEVDGELSADEFAKALDSLKGVTIQQRTPERVAHRRADKVRERRVLDISLVGEQDGRFVVEVLGEAGLYIKELVSGDSGRTTPSLAEILKRKALVTSLDVTQVEGAKEGE
ncbi:MULTISPECIES: tRNA pseudouridine(54/55) synthase Pus10 [unclassified Methanoregula]|uniref:tRNA pseudouridine(54/55) synthase Pus10 n=1 Tax=unclassified Methanoregula TaxID=2649730 RepID=UPI0009C62F65|nr:MULTISPECIES: tRNA pseudouridine(54/55) synthase Pus10 [unclassified Methanoregula]OPX65573.1 MAG: tRNA pseudouridine synthase Pus10 [Methanoregula sp. PtaB.Bin085]OPY35852.1 MAG: tRNA pseudouridine synthase Pus10 [Methanoregula sp. PtaU1.Bin006]